MQRLIQISDAELTGVSLQFKRFLYDRIDPDAHISGIVGPRGTGKSYLLKQFGQEKLREADDIVYLHMADPNFASVSLAETGSDFYKQGGKVMLLDDLHRYPDALDDIRYIVEQFPDLHIVFTCSSAGNEEGLIYELSRLAELHYLPVMSFREYLQFRHGLNFPAIRFDELLDYNLAPGSDVYHQIRPLAYFDDYLLRGAYPIPASQPHEYDRQLLDVTLRAISEDIMAIWHMDYDSLTKVNRIMNDIARQGIFKPNIEQMATAAGTSRDSLLKFLKYLHKAGIVGWVTRGNGDINYYNKPARLSLNDPNQLNVLAANKPLLNQLKEIVIIQQLSIRHQVNFIREGAYLVDLEYDFMLGWRSAAAASMKPNEYFINDQIERKRGNQIPLWMLCFFY